MSGKGREPEILEVLHMDAPLIKWPKNEKNLGPALNISNASLFRKPREEELCSSRLVLA